MPFAIALACFAMDMTFEEALVAATLNAAWSLDRAGASGSLESGKAADFVVVRRRRHQPHSRRRRRRLPRSSRAAALVHGTLPTDVTA